MHSLISSKREIEGKRFSLTNDILGHKSRMFLRTYLTSSACVVLGKKYYTFLKRNLSVCRKTWNWHRRKR